jgi:RNA polymerase sigma factor for flagellar operon FliA
MNRVADEEQLWARYRSGSDADSHQQLFFHYVPWARAVARDVYRRVRIPQLEWADYAQNATVGLLQAMSRFDAGRGIDFAAYAKPRVRGAVFNGLRSFLAESRTHNENNRWHERAESFDDPAPEDQLNQMISSVTGLGLGFLLDANAATELLASRPDASTVAECEQMDVLLAGSVAKLPEKEKLVVTLHYYQHMPFTDISELLGLTKGRISQLHKAALERIRSQLRTGADARQTV